MTSILYSELPTHSFSDIVRKTICELKENIYPPTPMKNQTPKKQLQKNNSAMNFRDISKTTITERFGTNADQNFETSGFGDYLNTRPITKVN
jgi:hypothetical protein